MPLDVPVDELAVHEPDYKNLIAFLKAMEFNTLTRRVAEKAGIDASAGRGGCEADVDARPPPREAAPAAKTGDLFAPPPQAKPGGKARRAALTPISLAADARRGRAQRQDRPRQIRMRAHARRA